MHVDPRHHGRVGDTDIRQGTFRSKIEFSRNFIAGIPTQYTNSNKNPELSEHSVLEDIVDMDPAL
jgi:hypothetical protein